MNPRSRVSAGLLLVVILLPLFIVSPVSGKEQQGFTWSRTYSQMVGPDFVQQTSDGGFVVAGANYSNVWVLKTNALGVPEWEKDYSPAGYYSSDVGSLQQTRDGGYIVAGSASHTGYARVDGWLLKLNQEGDVQWSKTYGGLADDGFYMAKQTVDGGYVAAGNTASVSSHVFNGWILKLDSFGNVVWQEAFVGEDIHSVDQTPDGGFIVAGTVGVDNRAEAWVFKLDPEGKMVWQKAYDAGPRTEAHSVQQNRDGYIVTGEVITFDTYGLFDSSEALILRLDREGNVLWQKLFGGGGFTELASVHQTPDRGFMIAGGFRPTVSRTFPFQARGISGPFLLKMSAKGDMVWQKTYGDTGGYFSEAQGSRDGGLIVSGALPTMGRNAWLLRLDGAGSIAGCPFGVPSNATIKDTQAIVANTNATAVGANETVSQTSVSAVAVDSSVQTQCFSVQDEDEGRNSRPHHEGNDQWNSHRIV
jgi:hypothetical protein